MKTFNLILLLLVLSYSCLGFLIFGDIVHKYQVFYPTEGDWTLVWDDDFNGPVLDQDKWTPVYRNYDYNSLQKDAQVVVSENVTVKDGCLELINNGNSWRDEDGRDNNFLPKYYYTTRYTSGQVATGEKCSWTYGRFKIRAKLPAGEGILSYASLYPADSKTFQEIFILRLYGQDPYTIFMGTNLGTDRQRRYLQKEISGKGYGGYGPDYSAGFHTFTVEWEPRVIRWFIDDIKVYQTKRNVPEIPLSLSLGTAVGGANVDEPHTGKINFNSLPQSLYIDWVRVYQRR